nr:immunoglobulin heavy chain junction region [Macaca mulatta]
CVRGRYYGGDFDFW